MPVISPTAQAPVSGHVAILPRLVTCSYTGYRRDMGTAVRISLGAPRWISLPNPAYSRYSRWPYLAELAPTREYLKSPYDVYKPQYLAQLDRLSADIDRKLGWIEAEHGALVLLCFEKRPDNITEWCHRRLFAEWYQERTGIIVPEVGAGR
jgi:hypothetical protein